jgi:hypothetical protein
MGTDLNHVVEGYQHLKATSKRYGNDRKRDSFPSSQPIAIAITPIFFLSKTPTIRLRPSLQKYQRGKYFSTTSHPGTA